jgi:hypothetical protein
VEHRAVGLKASEKMFCVISKRNLMTECERGGSFLLICRSDDVGLSSTERTAELSLGVGRCLDSNRRTSNHNL